MWRARDGGSRERRIGCCRPVGPPWGDSVPLNPLVQLVPLGVGRLLKINQLLLSWFSWTSWFSQTDPPRARANWQRRLKLLLALEATRRAWAPAESVKSY